MRTNEEKAAAGRLAMDAYSDEVGYDESRDETDSLTDLLADLIHAYGYRAMQHCHHIALEHYQFEIAEEMEE